MSGHNAPVTGYHSAPIIGYHRAPLSQKFGAPRQPNLVALTSVIEMMPPYDTPAAFIGLADFSHLWISWQFHHNHVNKTSHVNNAKKDDAAKLSASANKLDSSHEKAFRAQVRPPRLGGNQKIGVFASRSMYRPSGLGLSVVRLESVQVVQGRVLLIISGADMIDATPIIDIKPYIAYSDVCMDASSGFATTAPTPLEVTMTAQAKEQSRQIISAGQSMIDGGSAKGDGIAASVVAVIDKVQQQLIDADIEHIKALIAQDPRPAYRRDELNMPFVMRYKSVDVRFQQIALGQLEINGIQKYSTQTT